MMQRAGLPTGVPENWPPRGWPACPDRERFRAAWDYALENLEDLWKLALEGMKEFQRGNRVKMLTCKDAPSQLRRDVETVVADLTSRLIVQTMLMDQEESEGINKNHSVHHFLKAARMSSQTSIGMVILSISHAERMTAAYGVVHRDTEWTGLSMGFNLVRGHEALLFVDETHEPDVLMMMPDYMIGCDPGNLAGCPALEEIQINRTLMEVLRHHGARPYLVDVCGRETRMAETIGRLFGPDGEKAEENHGS